MMETFTTQFTFQNIKLEIQGTDDKINSILFSDSSSKNFKTTIEGLPEIIRQCVIQIEEYFSGKRKEFTIPFSLEGTDFQKRVWTELLKIPYGETITYLELAKRLGDEKCIRAAASANGKNKLSIIIPCHRVIGANGSLTGYAGGIENKRYLLELERKNSTQEGRLF
jgi:methylated-DNA-[protein]-cysteine S-methyltransferase